MNDPVAVLLVIGFIEWLEPARLRRAGHGPSCSSSSWASARSSASAVGWLAVQALPPRQPRDRRPVPGRVAGGRRARVRRRRRAARARDSSRSTSRAWRWARRRCPPARRSRAFHDGLAWLAQLTMFFTLGLLVFPSRPRATIALKGTRARARARLRRAAAGGDGRDGVRAAAHDRADRARLGGPARRRAGRARDVPDHRGHPGRRAVLQHRVLRRARLDAAAGLDVHVDRGQARRADRASRRCARPLVEVGQIRQLGADVVEVPLVEGDAAIGVRVRDLGLPRDALVNVLVRNDEALPPRGSTRLEAGDRLYVLARQSAMGALEEARERWRTGPVGPGAAARARGTATRRADLHDAAVDRGRRRPRRARPRARPRGRRPARHALGRPGRARRAVRRALRGDRPAACSSAAASSCSGTRAGGCGSPRPTPSAPGGRRSSAPRRSSRPR